MQSRMDMWSMRPLSGDSNSTQELLVLSKYGRESSEQFGKKEEMCHGY